MATALAHALREQKREDAEKEAAKNDQEKAPWDTPEEWAWHDAHAEGWAAAADEEKQNAAERSGSAAEGLDSSESETLQMDSHPSTPQASTAVAANHFASSTLESLRSATPRFDASIDQWRVPNDEAARLAYLFQVEVHSARIARIDTGPVSFSRSDLIYILDQAIFVLDAQSNFDIDHSRDDSDFDDVRETQ